MSRIDVSTDDVSPDTAALKDLDPPREDIKALAATGSEFNITLDLEISQQGFKGERDRRVGRCEATFHVTPKVHHKAKKARKAGK